MGSQTITSHERSRTYWTPVMERYFIDLMLEQLHRGNRSGHTFNKQAWTDMLTLFNAKFGSQYDKDVLKSRYTNLWKQFNDVKNLLGHSGFSWDESRQMVVADDYTWDIYIKAHPDSRPYKTKAVLNFSDLCLIYGYTSADGRYSRSSHDLDFEDELQATNAGDGIGCLAPPDRPRTDWTLDMDQFFIELMLDQVGRGNKTSNTFSKQAWTDMLVMFNAKFGSQHGKRVLRHRYKKLWKYYSDIMNLLQQKGFSWDDVQQMVVADDHIWDAFIKTHPFARNYRMKALPNYYDLVLIYGNVIDNENQGHLHLDKNLPDDISEVKGGQANESQMSSVSDRTRTYWTPPMDRYLIDLLLEQVHRGNKIGQTFVTHAWIDMVSAFNAQFRAHHDKDVLKNRYKHLRRLYNEIKILLEQIGFSWDENREIVTADDHIWDAYTKEHPDARSYRVKTVPSYHKLCVIFGEENSGGRYSRLAHDADPNNEVAVLMTGESTSDQVPAGGPFLAIDWSPQMDSFFIDLMLEQLQEGNAAGPLFGEQAWTYMTVLFNERFELRCDSYVLEDRYFWWMKQHSDICNLLSHSGFVWDESQQLITAPDDIWESYGKENPDALLYKDKFLCYHTDLCKIFRNVLDGRANGEDTGETHQQNLEMKIDQNKHLQPTVANMQISVPKNRPFATISSDRWGSKKRPKTENDMQKALSDMAGVVTRLVNLKQQHNYKTVEGAIDALQAIPEIDDELMLDACDLLEDEKKAKTFLALDVNLRKKWLLRKLRS